MMGEPKNRFHYFVENLDNLSDKNPNFATQILNNQTH